MGVRYSEAQSIFAFGPHQTNFQTEAAPASAPPNFRWVTKDGYAKATFNSPNVNNAGESTGLALPDKTYKDRDETTFQANEQLTYQLLGLRAYDAFGVAATPVVVIAAAVWKHVFTLLDPFVGAALPSRPLASKVAEPALSTNEIYNARFPSMTYSRFTVTDASDKPNLSLDSEWQGSGRLIEPSAIQFYGAGKHVLQRGEIVTEEAINKRGGVATIYPLINFGGTPIATNCIIREFTATINENLNVEGGYAGCALFQDDNPLLGAVAGSLDSTGQTVTYDILLIADSAVLQSFPVHPRLKAGTEFSLKQVYTGSVISGAETHKAEFKLSRAVIASVEWVAVDGGSQGIRIVTEPLAVGNAMPFSLELTTNVASFATYVGA